MYEGCYALIPADDGIETGTAMQGANLLYMHQIIAKSLQPRWRETVCCPGIEHNGRYNSSTLCSAAVSGG